MTFAPEQIINFELDNEILEKQLISQEKELYDNCNFFDRKKLSMLCKLRNSIIRSIELDSGWSYTSGSFSLKSDFKFAKSDILFKINKIKKTSEGYNFTDGTNLRERLFYNKYNDLLERLFNIERKIDKLYQKYKERIDDSKESKIVDINALSNKKNRITFANDYYQHLAYIFIREYGVMGVVELVNMLNELNDCSNPSEVVDRYIKENYITYKYDVFLAWASVYSNYAKVAFEEKESKKYYFDEKYAVDKEEIMTRNMVNLL